MTHTSEFEKQVIENLAVLQTKMDTLLGPEGRVQKVERGVIRLWAAVLGVGLGLALVGGPKIAQLLVYAMK